MASRSAVVERQPHRLGDHDSGRDRQQGQSEDRRRAHESEREQPACDDTRERGDDHQGETAGGPGTGRRGADGGRVDPDPASFRQSAAQGRDGVSQPARSHPRFSESG